MKRQLFIFALFALSLFGSASIINGKVQMVTFSSEPSAAVYVDNVLVCPSTPCNVPLARRNSPQHVVFKKEGYKDAQVFLNAKVSVMAIANVFGTYFSTSSSTTDFASGSAYEYEPGFIYMILQKK